MVEEMKRESLETGSVAASTGSMKRRNSTEFDVAGGKAIVSNSVLLLHKFVIELLGMMFFVICGCGAAISTSKTTDFNDSSWVLAVALAFGLAITTIAYTIGHVSGGHINCAVTFGLVIAGACGVVEGLVIFAGQIIGSILGASILAGIFNKSNDGTGALGANMVSPGFGQGSAFLGEAIMTALLMFTVTECAVRKRYDYMSNLKLNGVGFNAPIPIGFAVFLAHMLLIPIDGCSINPTRSFGPLVIATARGLPDESKHWEDFWVFVVGPFVGAGVAAAIHRITKVQV